MTKERLEEIKDSINLQYEIINNNKEKYESIKFLTDETKELYNYVIELENMNKEIRKYVEDNKKIGKLKYHNSIPDTEDIKDSKLFIKEILKNENYLMDKINEIIDKINNME